MFSGAGSGRVRWLRLPFSRLQLEQLGEICGWRYQTQRLHRSTNSLRIDAIVKDRQFSIDWQSDSGCSRLNPTFVDPISFRHTPFRLGLAIQSSTRRTNAQTPSSEGRTYPSASGSVPSFSRRSAKRSVAFRPHAPRADNHPSSAPTSTMKTPYSAATESRCSASALLESSKQEIPSFLGFASVCVNARRILCFMPFSDSTIPAGIPAARRSWPRSLSLMISRSTMAAAGIPMRMPLRAANTSTCRCR